MPVKHTITGSIRSIMRNRYLKVCIILTSVADTEKKKFHTLIKSKGISEQKPDSSAHRNIESLRDKTAAQLYLEVTTCDYSAIILGSRLRLVG